MSENKNENPQTDDKPTKEERRLAESIDRELDLIYFGMDSDD